MSPISIPSCDEEEVEAFPVSMVQPGMSFMFGQKAAASTWLQPLTKSREMTQMRRSRFIEIPKPPYCYMPIADRAKAAEAKIV